MCSFNFVRDYRKYQVTIIIVAKILHTMFKMTCLKSTFTGTLMRLYRNLGGNENTFCKAKRAVHAARIACRYTSNWLETTWPCVPSKRSAEWIWKRNWVLDTFPLQRFGFFQWVFFTNFEVVQEFRREIILWGLLDLLSLQLKQYFRIEENVILLCFF